MKCLPRPSVRTAGWGFKRGVSECPDLLTEGATDRL